MTYFGFFDGMGYDGSEDFNEYKNNKNELSKSIILAYLKELPIAAIAPMWTYDMFTREKLGTGGLIEDGDFCFPVDFIHYFGKYDIGIPIEYEKHIIIELRNRIRKKLKKIDEKSKGSIATNYVDYLCRENDNIDQKIIDEYMKLTDSELEFILEDALSNGTKYRTYDLS